MTTLQRKIAVILAAATLPAAWAQQPPSTERRPKTPLEMERQAESVRTRDLSQERYLLPPLTSANLRAAVTRFEPPAAGAAQDFTARWGEFLAADGKYFVALQVSCGPATGCAPAREAVLFGVIKGPGGSEELSFEVPRTLQASGARQYTDLTLPLEAGEYLAVVGIAAEREPLAVTGFSLNPNPIPKDAFTASRLLLAENVFALPAAQQPDDPFAFGGLKVVLRGNASFASSEEAWLFLVLRHLGLDAAGSPKVAVKATVTGPAGPQSRVRQLPVGDAAPMPLKGFEGQWALGLPVGFAPLPAGEYEVQVEVRDSVSGQSKVSATSFRVASP